MEAAYRVDPFLNFAWDLERIESSDCRDQIIPSPLGMVSYETIDMSLPTLGTELFSNHQSIPISAEPCFLGSRVNSYEYAMHLRRHILTIRNNFSNVYENAKQHDANHMTVFGEYTRTNAAHSFFKSVADFQNKAVTDWNEFQDNVTLSYNMGFVGLRGDSSSGAALVILDMLLKFGVFVYKQDKTWSLHCLAKLRRFYCFGDWKTIENSSAFVNKLSNRNLSFKESSLQAEIFLDAFDKVMFLPGDWHTGMNMLQSIYKLFWTNLLKPLWDILGWKRISKDVSGCYFQAYRLVKYANNVVSTYLLRSYMHCHYEIYVNGLIHDDPADLYCLIAVNYHSFLMQLGQSTDEHLRMIVNFSNVSLDFLEFVAAYQSQDNITVKSGYKWFALIWRILGWVKYLEATWEQINVLYGKFPYSRLQEI